MSLTRSTASAVLSARVTGEAPISTEDAAGVITITAAMATEAEVLAGTETAKLLSPATNQAARDADLATVNGLLVSKASNTSVNALIAAEVVARNAAIAAEAALRTAADATKANATHTHVIGDVTGLQAALDAKATAVAVAGLWTPRYWGGAQQSHTGDALEHIFQTLAINGTWMGPNGRLRVWTTWTFTASAEVKTCRVRAGGPSGTAYLAYATTTGTIRGLANIPTTIVNRNSASSQIGGDPVLAAGQGGTNNALTTGALDTSVSWDLVLSGQLAVGTVPFVALESYFVETFYAA